MTRLLLVDGSDLMGWLVEHLIPSNVNIVRATSFSQADQLLREQPPDVAVFNLTPRHLDWRFLLDRCIHHEPVIPFLCCTALENDEELDGPLPCRQEDYFTKSISQSEFRTLLGRLTLESRVQERGRFSENGERCGVPDDRILDPPPA